MLKYVKGDATYPQTENECIIPHIVNDEGLWGSGFVIALNKRWSLPHYKYQELNKQKKLRLGDIDVFFVDYKPNTFVCNMVAQKGVITQRFKFEKDEYRISPIRYEALKECMIKVAQFCLKSTPVLEIHCPKFGSLRAGGNWLTIENMIKEIWVSNDIPVTVYEYEN